MKFVVLVTLFALIALCICEGSAQPPPNCFSNIAILCGGGPKVQAKAGSNGQCEPYDSKCLVEQLNCLRYKSNEPLLELC